MSRRRSARGRPAGVEPEPDDELVLRGATVGEATKRLEEFLVSAEKRHHRRLRIVHGKGIRSEGGVSPVRAVVQGRLEQALAEGRIRDFRLGNVGEGGAGVTVVWL